MQATQTNKTTQTTQELQTVISSLTFKSFCGRMVHQENGTIEFELKHNFHGNRSTETFCIQEVDDNLIISDMGCTFKNLDDVFEMSAPDVVKNIIAILKHYGMIKIGNSLIYRLDPRKGIIPEIMRFVCGIQFLYAMKIFYT